MVQRLFELLKSEPVIHADETGWRINGRNVWVWCFCNPRLALFLVDEHRSGAVVKRVLGDSLPGVLVTDFYASYHAIDCRKQKCLVHLLRELHTLRDEATPAAKNDYLQPLMTRLQDALALGHARGTLAASEFADARQRIENRLDTLIYTRPTDKDCRRIDLRLVKHRFDLLCFLEVAGVPPDNNLGERDIRSVAAARRRRRCEPDESRSHRVRKPEEHRPHLPETRPQLSGLRPDPDRNRRKVPTVSVPHPRNNSQIVPHQHILIQSTAAARLPHPKPIQHARTAQAAPTAC